MQKIIIFLTKSTLYKKLFFYSMLFFLLCLFFLSCGKLEFSPYDTHVADEDKELSRINMTKINNLQLGESYSFAVISDTHNFYDDLNDFIFQINKLPDIAFVLITGDITQSGSLNDYNILYDCFLKLNKPVLTVIGNHEYFLNGEIIYKQMFGNINYSFLINDVKYIFFDSNIGSRPDNFKLNWLENEIMDTLTAKKHILFSHIAPYSFINESDSTSRIKFLQLLSYPHIIYSFFGHEHKWEHEADIKLVHVDCIEHRNFARVDINNDTVLINQIFY